MYKAFPNTEGERSFWVQWDKVPQPLSLCLPFSLPLSMWKVSVPLLIRADVLLPQFRSKSSMMSLIEFNRIKQSNIYYST